MFNTFIRVLALLALCTGIASAQSRIVRPPGTKPGGNFSQGILVDGTLYVSGQAGEDASGKIPAAFEAEVQQALDNIDTVLKAAGMSSADVVSAQVYLTRGEDFPKMNAVYTKFFADPRPTRTTVVVARLVGEGHVEVTVTARKH